MTDESKKIIFIYNSQSGLNNAMIDFFHKIISPKSYECNLCALTYNNIVKKKKWIKYLNSINRKIFFLYKDHLKELDLPKNTKLPAVFNEKNQLLINSNQINECKKLEELINLVKQITKKSSETKTI